MTKRMNLLELGFVKVGPREFRFPSCASYEIDDDGKIVIEIEGRGLLYLTGATIGLDENTLIVPKPLLN